MPITLFSIWQVSELLGHTWQLLSLSRRVGENLQTASGQSTLCWKWTGNRVSLVMVGSGPLLCQFTAGRLRTASDHVYPFLSKLCSDLKEDAVKCPIHLFPHLSVVSFRFLRLPSAASSPPLAPSPSFLAFLPVWPSP